MQVVLQLTMHVLYIESRMAQEWVPEAKVKDTNRESVVIQKALINIFRFTQAMIIS